MKVIQINEVCGRGSTGSICQDISELSNRSGIDNIVYYGQKQSDFKYSKKFGYHWLNLVHSVLFTRILGLHGFGSIINTLILIKELKKHNPDIIHLHSLHTNFINYPILYNYIAKSDIPVVMTLHDCYNFTGQCEHYVEANCKKFQNGCGKCPLIHKTIAPSFFFDWSKWLLSHKKSWYEKLNSMTVVAVSKWLKKETCKSSLNIDGHKIISIYNWIDTAIFYPRTYKEIQRVRQKYSIQNYYKYIIAVAARWNYNTSKYNDIIKLNSLLPPEYKLIVVGGNSPDAKFPNSIIRISYTQNADDLACLYSLSYAYIHVSTCDTFGKVIAEAMACGTTPIVYNSTACPEVTGGFGVTVEPHDLASIVACLDSIPHEPEAMVKFVKREYNKELNISQYIELYKSLICK